jgi:hypothetical protein
MGENINYEISLIGLIELRGWENLFKENVSVYRDLIIKRGKRE